ncbi:uncharacterized protein LOC134056975 [Cinclus cinclus]|uniref:uncharacterized protein LOC134056975 n=1 Tax=Cinclus cinclus TaxID=127875 RepID=UPI002E147160
MTHFPPKYYNSDIKGLSGKGVGKGVAAVLSSVCMYEQTNGQRQCQPQQSRAAIPGKSLPALQALSPPVPAPAEQSSNPREVSPRSPSPLPAGASPGRAEQQSQGSLSPLSKPSPRRCQPQQSRAAIPGKSLPALQALSPPVRLRPQPAGGAAGSRRAGQGGCSPAPAGGAVARGRPRLPHAVMADGLAEMGPSRSLGAAPEMSGRVHPGQQEAAETAAVAGTAPCHRRQGVRSYSVAATRSCGRGTAGLGSGSLAPEHSWERFPWRAEGLGVPGFS